MTAYVEKLGWSIDASTGVVSIPPNPDNQIESTVVQENIQLPRTCPLPPSSPGQWLTTCMSLQSS